MLIIFVKSCVKTVFRLTFKSVSRTIISMKYRDEILKLLANSSDYLSGQEIANKFNISREYVFKCINALRAEGYNIIGQKPRGYLLENAGLYIDCERIEKETGLKTEYYKEIDSTSNRAYALYTEGERGAVVVARTQSKGRARRGKKFESDVGGTYFSILIKKDLPFKAAAAVTDELLKSVAAKCRGEVVENTVYKGGRKLCGILTETIADMDMLHAVIVGIGIYRDPALSPATELIISLTLTALSALSFRGVSRGISK